MTTEVHLQEREPVDTDADVVSADEVARTAAAEAQAALGQYLRAPDVPAQASADRADHELAEGPAVAHDDDTEAPVEHGVCQFGAEAPEAAEDKQEAVLETEPSHGPYYDWLQTQGDAGKALEPYLKRLAVTKDDYLVRGMMSQDMEGDDLNKGLLDRLGDWSEACSNSDISQLTDILRHSVQELHERPELLDDGRVNWLGLSTALLDRAKVLDEDTGDRIWDGLLTSATTAALMSENPDDRIAFLEQTFERGLEDRMAVALDRTGVSIVYRGFRNTDVQVADNKGVRPDRSILPLAKFRAVFYAERDEVTRYKQLVERNQGESADAHTAMKDMIADYDTPGGDAANGGHAERLEAASISAPYVDRYRVDPTKAERFALEEMFVQTQMDTLFPGGDTNNVRRMLGLVRPTDGDARQLVTDTRAVIQAMSRPVAAKFHVPAGKPGATWRREQLAAWRYRQLSYKAGVYDNIQKFVDPTLYGSTSNFPSNITELSRDGAAFPAMAHQAVTNVVELAKAYTAETGDPVAPKELRDLMQANRRQLMKVSAIHIDTFAASLIENGGERAFGQRPHVTKAAEIVRGPDGKLGLKGPLFQPEKASSRSAARLACVALRVNVERKEADSDRGGSSKVNSIDLLSEVFIDEAYERGVFTKALEPVAA